LADAFLEYFRAMTFLPVKGKTIVKKEDGSLHALLSASKRSCLRIARSCVDDGAQLEMTVAVLQSGARNR
jgi:hypothetical protein